jgi:hypothetical protein
MMERLFARPSAEIKAFQAEMKAAYAEMEARAEALHERFLARLDGLTPYGKGSTTFQTETTSCSGEMDATTLRRTQKKQRPQWSGRNPLKNR